jgi:hypothetical protein
MRTRIRLGLSLLLLMAVAVGTAAAQPPVPPMLPAIGYEAISVGATAKTLTAAKIVPADAAINGNATAAFLSIEAAPIYICVDGTTASATGCHRFEAGAQFLVYSTRTLQQMSFYGPSGTVTVKVSYFREIGK